MSINAWLENTIVRLVLEAPENELRDFDGVPIFDAPIVGIADGDDEIFQVFRKAVSPRHLLPREILKAEHHPVMKRLAKRITIVHRGCRAGRDRLTINPSGWISPCVCLDVPPAYAGNIRRDGLQDLFQASPICDIFQRPERYGICSDCLNVKRCGGGCRAAGFALTGRLDGQDKSCPLWKSRTDREILETHDR